MNKKSTLRSVANDYLTHPKGRNGITLIALVITIIVLLILAGVSITMLTGDNAILSKAGQAREATRGSGVKEYVDLTATNNAGAQYTGGEKTTRSKAISELHAKGELTDEEVKLLETQDVITIGGIDIDFSVLGTNALPGSTLLRKNAPIISVPGLKYADLDGDGIADGIIVADISKDSIDTTTYKGGNPWGGLRSGSFSYTKKETSELREYSENTSYKYTNADGSKENGTLIKCTNNTGIPRYYILSLANYDGNEHYWYKNAYNKMSDQTFTSEDFGKGKENTEKMIERMKNHANYKYDYGEPTTGERADIWNIIEDKVKEGWFVPSIGEWAAFGSYLNTSRPSTDINYYVKYGLNDWYWSSSQCYMTHAWTMSFINGESNFNPVFYTERLRLCKTF